MKRLAWITLICFFSTYAYAASNCNKNTIPKLIKKLENYEIIATNTATIPTKEAFRGEKLSFHLQAKKHHRANKLRINHKTGKLTVIAEKQDQFDVKIIAKNACGSAQTIFNIIIDEEI